MPADAPVEPFVTKDVMPADAPVEPLFTKDLTPEDSELPEDGPVDPFVTKDVTPESVALPENLQELVDRDIELRRDNRELKARVEKNDAELKQLDKIIVDQFAARRLQQQKLATGETVYVQKSVYASLVRDKDGEHNGAHKALRDNGLEWLVEGQRELKQPERLGA